MCIISQCDSGRNILMDLQQKLAAWFQESQYITGGFTRLSNLRHIISQILFLRFLNFRKLL